MQSKDESSKEENYVRLLHCPNAYLEMLRSHRYESARQTSLVPILESRHIGPETQQLYVRTLPRDKATIHYQSSN